MTGENKNVVVVARQNLMKAITAADRLPWKKDRQETLIDAFYHLAGLLGFAVERKE